MAATTWGPQPPHPEHTHAYRIVSDFFQRHRRDVVEIEVLPPAIAPPSGSPVLEDGLCLGVPKRLLAAAFIAACSIFFDKRASSDSSSVQAALDATSVILLFDPEHLTAANFRRTQLNNIHHVQLELNFLDSILTSPLHRQSKSPTLWGYRAWILQSFDPWLLLSRACDQDVGPASSWEHFSCELGVVLKAGERHPKNYYAWQYARRLCERIIEWQDPCQHKLPSQHPSPLTSSSLATPGHGLLLQSIPIVHDWCLRNPSDTSAWSFLHFLLLQIPKRTQLAQQIVDSTLGLAQDFRWKHESLWTFLRTVIADSTLISADARHQYLLAMESIYKRKEDSPSRAKSIAIKADHPAENAVLWILQNASV